MYRERVQLLGLLEPETGIYSWVKLKDLWVNGEIQAKNNLFSSVGIGARSVRFELHPHKDLTLHRMLRWNGLHCFLTGIIPVSPVRVEVTAALVELVGCTATRAREDNGSDGKPKRQEFRREPDHVATFPGILTEKYAGFRQQMPMARTQVTYVLVTPKAIQLQTGDLVETGGRQYPVQVCHTLDPFKNEYELHRKEDT